MIDLRLAEPAKPGTRHDESGYSLAAASEFAHELAWNVMRDYFAYQGNPAIAGSRDAAREAFGKGLVTDGEGWMDMIGSRNQTSHTYNRAVADDIVQRILQRYHPLFLDFLARMRALQTGNGG